MAKLRNRRLLWHGLVLTLVLACTAVVFAQGFTHLVGIVLNEACTVRTGTGTPEGSVTGVVCDVYLRTNGGAASTFYVKESGSGNTGWAAPGSGSVPAGPITTSGLTMATARLLGRTTASTGAVEEISVGSGLTLSGGSLNTASTAPNVCQTGEFDAGNSGTSITLNWNNGASQLVTLNDNLGTLTLTNPVAGCTYRIEFVEDGTGGRTIAFPGSVKFENDTTPAVITTADKIVFCSFVYTTIGADGYLGWCTTNPISKP